MPLSAQDIMQYSERHRAGEVSLTFKNIKQGAFFIAALETDIGTALLSDAVKQMDSLAMKVLDSTATEEEHAIYKAYREIIGTWARRIEIYLNAKKRIKESRNGRPR